jgi:uncharacterized DUF497 family protein
LQAKWDPAKARLNQNTVSAFGDAVICLEDQSGLTMRDPFSEDEERWATIGLDALGRVAVVVYTWRGQRLCPISAPKATARERRRHKNANET